jgi:hypothetical protein
MPTVAIFPRKVRLDSCEGRLAFQSLSPVFAGSFGESSFNVALGQKTSAEVLCQVIYVCKTTPQHNAGKTLGGEGDQEN